MEQCCLNLIKWYTKPFSAVWAEFMASVESERSEASLADQFNLLPTGPRPCGHEDAPLPTLWTHARDKLLTIHCVFYLLSRRWLQQSFPTAFCALREKLPAEMAILIWTTLQSQMQLPVAPKVFDETGPIVVLGDAVQIRPEFM